MTDIKNNGPGEEQLVIDKQYKLQERSKSIEIIRRAMDLAREEIPKGKVATYIPELGKVDPHQLGIVVNPLKGEKICMGDYNVRFTMQSVSKVLMLEQKKRPAVNKEHILCQPQAFSAFQHVIRCPER